MSEIRHTFAQACEEAARKDLVVKVAMPDELFVDIDDETSRATFKRTLNVVHEIAGTKWWKESPSPSGEEHHTHIVVKLGRAVKDETERLLLQAILGSDPMREGLNYKRVLAGETIVTVFFEKPEKAEKDLEFGEYEP